MVQCRRIDDSRRQVPHSDEASADFAMVRAEHLFFNVPKGDRLFAGERMDAAVQIIKVLSEDNFAEIMEQPGSERLRREGSILCLKKHQVPGDLTDVHTMLPYLVEGQ